jgi:hypothetical protein
MADCIAEEGLRDVLRDAFPVIKKYNEAIYAPKQAAVVDVKPAKQSTIFVGNPTATAIKTIDKVLQRSGISSHFPYDDVKVVVDKPYTMVSFSNYVGFAKHNPTDTYSAEIGIKIAASRAAHKYVEAYKDVAF